MYKIKFVHNMKWVKIIAICVLSILFAVLLTISIQQRKHIKVVEKVVKDQQVVIDSLLTVKRNSVTIQLNVTDKSVNKVYGRYNKGTIEMPSTKSYTLDVDSVKLFR